MNSSSSANLPQRIFSARRTIAIVVRAPLTKLSEEGWARCVGGLKCGVCALYRTSLPWVDSTTHSLPGGSRRLGRGGSVYGRVRRPCVPVAMCRDPGVHADGGNDGKQMGSGSSACRRRSPLTGRRCGGRRSASVLLCTHNPTIDEQGCQLRGRHCGRHAVCDPVCAQKWNARVSAMQQFDAQTTRHGARDGGVHHADLRADLGRRAYQSFRKGCRAISSKKLPDTLSTAGDTGG